MKEFQHIVTTADGIRLSVREYLPDVASAQRTLVFVHGGCEHGGRYAEFAQAATARGWRVLIPDHRGHGLSTGIRVHVRVFETYVDDLRLVCRHFSLEPRQSAIVGHSMGGLIVARLLERPEEPFAAACLLSPFIALRIRVDRLTLILGRLMANVWPWFRFRSRVRAVDLSQDQQYLELRKQDTLLNRSVTAGWFFAVHKALQEVRANAFRVQIPLLVLQGDQDQVVTPQATEEWFQLAGSADKTLDMLPGHLHELLKEPDRDQTTQRILDWLDERVRS